jgi:glycosyltransferase involved in cell wall biosynthesis
MSLSKRIWFEVGQLFRATASYDPKRLLFIEHKVPEPDIDAGSRGNLAFLRDLLTLGYSVTFLQTNRRINPAYAPLLADIGVGLLSYPEKYAKRWLKKHAGSFGCVVFSRPENAEKYLPLFKQFSKAKTILYGHDIHFQRLSRQAQATGQAQFDHKALAMEKMERSLWNSVDLALYFSQEEVDLIKALEPAANVDWVIPYCWDDFAGRTTPPKSLQLLFMGGFAHSPNIDAAMWLVKDIFPLLLELNSKVELVLAGSNPTAEVLALAGPNIKVTGYVTDTALAELYQTARVAVIPLRFGAGVKLKVVEAFHAGLPVVTTPTGIQGLPALEGIVTSTMEPHVFAQVVADLLTNDHLWLEKSRQQSYYVQRNFSKQSHFESVGRAMSNLDREQ